MYTVGPRGLNFLLANERAPHELAPSAHQNLEREPRVPYLVLILAVRSF